MNVPDPRLLRLDVERGDGTIDICTLDNGGIQFSAATEKRKARVYFQAQCVRKPTDKQVSVKLFCAG